MNDNYITNLADAINPQDAVTLRQIPWLITNSVGKNGLSLNNNTIQNVSPAMNLTDAVNLAQVQLLISAQIIPSFESILNKNNSTGSNLINMNNNKIINLANATSPQDAITLSQIPSLVTSSISANDLTLNNHRITNLANATSPQDAVALSQIPSLVTKSISANDLTLNNHRITNLANATSPQDAVTVQQLNNAITSNAGLAGVLTVSNNAGNSGINMNNNVIENISELTVKFIDEITPGAGISFFSGNDVSNRVIMYQFEDIIKNSTTVTSLIDIPLTQYCAYTSTLKVGYYVTDGPNSGLSGNIYFLDRINYTTNVTKKTMTSSRFSDVPGVAICVLETTNGISVSMIGSISDTLSVSGTIELVTHK
ncbi:MAG: hypothetical protein EOP34_09790 [Rickettsiales bacterium]|nr:MAG: hypothetical protein EOP34_09790 [Rickettsiales bacterium]